MRPTCLRCLRTRADCYCGRIRSFSAGARFVILQHPKEFRNRVGTARMASLCLSNSVLIAGELEDREARAAEIVRDPRNRCALLYPGRDAVEPARFVQESDGRDLVIFVIDATWAMAKKMVRLSPVLSSLPKIAFAPKKPSAYRFRRQPRPECVSTIEAIHEVIDELDRSGSVPVSPRGAHENLLEVFEWMATRQFSFTEGTR
jgi:DTW domain-containing protein